MDWFVFSIFFTACAAAATTGALFQPGDWYDNLDKPSWTPPNWVFPLTWTILYVLMAYAGVRVAVLDNNAVPVAFWALQIAVNTLWTPMFFGLRRLRVGFYTIVLLWVAVAGFMISAYQIDAIAGLLFVPYLIWVTIASALNFSVWRRNPDVEPLN